MNLENWNLNKIHDWLWEIPKDVSRNMRVPARIYTSESMLDEISRDRSLQQLADVAALPGIVEYALAMPDVHEGYGFPVGGVAAFDLDEGIISPGGIGYDINCGVRLLASDLVHDDIRGKEKEVAHSLKRSVPSGVGRGGSLRLSPDEMDDVLENGARWAVKKGYGKKVDLDNIESQGCLDAADPSAVSDRAKRRGRDQLGTLGAGNHFIDVMVVDKIFGDSVADEWGLYPNQLLIMIHTGSRGLGHQIATDYIRMMMSSLVKYKIELPDSKLACAPFQSEEGQQYFGAMSAGANYAWANRQMIMSEVVDAWQYIFGPKKGRCRLVYDVAHNIAKVEEYDIGGKRKKLVIHRKGATRAFPGQPVLIPGSMGTASYVLVGQEKSLKEAFGSSCHGAGRRMSRSQAKREVNVEKLLKDLEKDGIYVEAGSYRMIAEEAPSAYKDVHSVVDVISNAGIAKKVCRVKPVAVVIG